MAYPPRTCDPLRLDWLLRDRLPDIGRRDLEAHLAGCPACRDRLDALAGGARWWSQVRHYLGDPSTAAEGTPRRPAGIDLDFLQPSDDPAVLGRLGPYEVQEVVGRGGMGVVLKAFEPALHRPVAIKVLSAEVAADGTARKRFAREAQAAAAVVHDHVVPVHAVDAAASPPYLVMAFIPGRSLQQRLDQSGPLELKEILRIGMQAASGLAAAHAQGLVHRDIKPANIMLENGVERVRITDFGLARAVDDASVTRHGAVAGTPQYMAPEQARGEVVDQRADLFSLGSTLYAMATGRPPFRGDGGLAVLRQVCDTEPAPVRSLNPDIPAWLEGIIGKLHAKDPAQRFASAAIVADLLERCLAHVQQPDRNPLPSEAAALGRQTIGPRPRPTRRLAAAFLVMAVLACATFLLWDHPFRTNGGTASRQQEHVTEGDASLLPYVAFQDDQFQQDTAQLRNRLGALWSTGGENATDSGDTSLNVMRWRVEKLRQEMITPDMPGPDTLDGQIDAIRRRLDLLRQQCDFGARLQ